MTTLLIAKLLSVVWQWCGFCDSAHHTVYTTWLLLYTVDGVTLLVDRYDSAVDMCNSSSINSVTVMPKRGVGPIIRVTWSMGFLPFVYFFFFWVEQKHWTWQIWTPEPGTHNSTWRWASVICRIQTRRCFWYAKKGARGRSRGCPQPGRIRRDARVVDIDIVGRRIVSRTPHVCQILKRDSCHRVSEHKCAEFSSHCILRPVEKCSTVHPGAMIFLCQSKFPQPRDLISMQLGPCLGLFFLGQRSMHTHKNPYLAEFQWFTKSSKTAKGRIPAPLRGLLRAK